MVRFLPLSSTKYSRLNTGFFVFEVCMSRSFKKVAGYVDRNPFMKRYSNKSLRRASRASLQAISNPNKYDGLVSSFSYFKRCSVNQYDICDYKSLYFTTTELKVHCTYFTTVLFQDISPFTTSTQKTLSRFGDPGTLKRYYRLVTK